MASPSYDEILRDMHSQLHRKLERQDIADKRFARVGTAEEVLAPYNLGRFFCSLAPLDDHFGPDITADSLTFLLEERNLYNFLAIFIYARCSIESARGFVAKLLISPEYHGAEQLPANREQLQQIFGTDGPDIISFMDTQSCFCPIVLYEGEDIQALQGVNQRLPYVSDEEYIDTGSYGIVYRVEIAKGHLRNRDTKTVNTDMVKMARKDFKKIYDLHKEHDIIKHIRCTPRKSKNIVETFCSLQLDENTFSLFMPYADFDLRMWMKKTTAPILESEKADILKCASGLADGLEFLHSEIRDPDGNQMICYHMDLKPANILVFLDEREPTKMIWKISDFGMSRVKISHPSTATNEKDMTAPFEKRGGEASASGTVNRRFEATYLAPESAVSMRKMNEKSDVWSLGCIISVIFTYLGEGQDGINRYMEDRAVISQSSGGVGNMDRFFLVGRNPTQPKSHPAISKHHKQLSVEANRRSSDEGRIMADILKYVEEKILQLEPKRRDRAKSIRDKLLNVSADYHKLSNIPNDSEDHHQSGVSVGRGLPWWKPFHRKKKPDGPKVEIWEVSDTKSATGCAIAPNEFVLVYWTSTRISLYNSQSLPYSGNQISRVAEYRLRGTNFWKSIKLTDTYLIASITGHYCHVHMFDLKDSGLPGLSFNRSYEVVLPVDKLNGLYQIAISPGSKVLACVVHQDADRCWVLYANIQDLLSHQSQRRGSESTLSSGGGPQYRIDAVEQWNRFTVDASAGSVTHLLFTSDTTLCCVAQPDVSERHAPHITCLSIPNKSIKSYYLDKSSDVEFDSGNWGRLFTTLTAIDTEQTLAIVLYENQLVIRNFIDPSPRFRTQTTFRNYFIVKLLMDEQHSRLFALGNRSGHASLLLMELPLTRLSHREKPQEIKEFPGISHRDKFTARLFRGTSQPLDGASGESSDRTNVQEADGEGYIIISTFAGSQPRLHKVILPNPR